MILTILTFTIVLSLLVFVHEAGHFLAARAFGITVEEFGFGFPPRAWGFSRGGTTYSVNWIPLGGFVRLKGEAGDSRAKDSFAGQSLLRRLAVIAAGVVMNVLLATGLFSVGYGIGIPQEIGGPLPYGAHVRDRELQIAEVLDGSPAERAAFLPRDQVIAVDGATVRSGEDFRARVAAAEDREISVTVRRGDVETALAVTPTLLAETGKPGIGVALFESGVVSFPWYLAPVAGVRATATYAIDILLAFGDLVRSLVTTGAPSVDVSGPVGIAVLTGKVARLGFIYLLQFTALLSLNLAIINILPIPALDGGRVLFLAIERARGRAVSARIETMVHQAGFAALLLLVAVVTFYDVMRFFR